MIACFSALLLLSSAKAAQEAKADRSDLSTAVATVYRVETMSPALAKHLQQLAPYQLLILEKINRADRRHLPRLPEIVIPERWKDDELTYSPMPTYEPWAANYPKAIVVDQRIQAFAAYEYGRLIRWGPVSTGRKNRPTPDGLFHLNWKSRGRHSTVNPQWYMPWYFNFDNLRGLSFHAYGLPGHPASHACVRLLVYDAKWLYYWGEQATVSSDQRKVLKNGTPVMIKGRYDYASPPLWRSTAMPFQ